VRITTHFYLVLRLQMIGSIPLLHSYDFMVRTGTPYFSVALFSGDGMSLVPVVVL
jgi:hypothetical protein